MTQPAYYERCPFCGERPDFDGATVVVNEVAEPIFVPFGEDWRGGLVEMAHPECFIEHQGVAAFLAALARHSRAVRGR